MRIAIIGGGIIGLCSAYYLHKKGYQITVIDKGDINDGCSFGNSGYVCPSHFTPLASPGIVAQGIRWMMSSSSPFYIKPRFNYELAKWCVSFWRNSNAATVEKNAPHLYNLLTLSRKLTSDIKNEVGNSFDMEEKGILMLYKTTTVEQHEKELAEKSAAFGLKTQILNGDEVQALEPAQKVDVLGGVLYTDDAHLHPGKLMKALYNDLEKKGINFMTRTSVVSFEKQHNKVTSVITDKGKLETDEVVLSAGSWLPLVSRKLGVPILLQPGKGYSLTFSNIDGNLNYPSILVDRRVAMTPMGKDLRMGGTMEISGINNNLLVKRAEAIYNAAKSYYPELPVSFPETNQIWNGLRPLSPDGLPYLGRPKQYKNVVIAGGHAMLGLALAAGSGKVVEEIISNEKSSVPLEAFKVERFG
ncbi:MAG TPA: FAD-dependent oxidoreductase [Chitinophagaceae bacterium]